jgi:hypothetical protein
MAEEGFNLASLHFPEINASRCAKALTNFDSAPLPVGTSLPERKFDQCPLHMRPAIFLFSSTAIETRNRARFLGSYVTLQCP